jgi:hypothetical protein
VVVRQAFDGGESGAAVGAGYEEVFVAGVFGVAEFFEAGVADGDVGRDDGARLLCLV